MKKLLISLLLAIITLAIAYIIAQAATFTTCQTLRNEMNGNEREAVICHTVNVKWLHDPYRVACAGNGTRTITLYNGYTAKLGTLYCKPKEYTTGNAKSRSVVDIWRWGYRTDFGRIDCVYHAWVPWKKSCTLSQAH